MNNNLCPVCGSAREDFSCTACRTCGTPYAFEELFASSEAFESWKAYIEEAVGKHLSERFASLEHCELAIGDRKVSILNRQTGEAVIIGYNREPEKLENVRQISMSQLNQLVLYRDGTVECRGDNEYGQATVCNLQNIAHVLATPKCTYAVCDNGAVITRGSSPLREYADQWQDVVALACGAQHLVALTKQGTVLQAGRPQDETAAWQNVKAIAAAANYTIALHTDGTVSYDGFLNDPKSEVKEWRNIVAIAADTQYAVGLTADGRILLAGKSISAFTDMNRSQTAEWGDIALLSTGRSVIGAVTKQGQLRLAGNILGSDDLCKSFTAPASNIL